jgi:uncharacterized protein (DUF302 family)
MLKKIFISLFVVALSLVAKDSATASAVDVAKSSVITIELQEDREAFETNLKKALTDNGYIYVGIHENIQDSYKKKFGTTKMAILDFISYYKPELFSTIAKESATAAGAFYPFTFVVHQSLNDKKMYVSYLNAPFIKTAGGLKNADVLKAIDKEYVDLQSKVSTAAKNDKLSGVVEVPATLENTIFEYKVKIPEGATPDRFLNKVSSKLDEFIAAGNFINAGFRGINGDMKKIGNETFDVYDEVLLCSFPISNAIFNDYPHVGAFAPCPVFIYKEKNSEYLTIGVLDMNLWAQYGAITSEKTQKIVANAAKEVQFVLKYAAELAVKEIEYDIMMEEDDDL